jgi:predicted aspartyl protease
MTMRFLYHRFKMRRPMVSLGGLLYRSRPIVRVTVVGPKGTAVEDGLLDTGADDTVFSDSMAVKLGIDLCAAPTGEAGAAGGARFPVSYGRVNLRITDGHEFREWETWVAFTKSALRRPLLGMAGFLQFFRADFNTDLEFVDLTVNRLYPGV